MTRKASFHASTSRALRRAVVAGASALTLTVLAACGGSIGQQTADSSGSEAGFAFGAEQGQVDGIVQELDPVELRMQVGVAPNAVTAKAHEAFKEYVETRSDGQIAIDLVWSNGIASFDEVDDALIDGRLDIAYTIPTYHQTEYPRYMGFGAMTVDAPAGPIAAEAITMMAMSAFAMESKEMQSEFEDKGLRLLSPAISTGQYNQWCGEPAVDPSSWQGRTISIPNASLSEMMQSIGAAPVSLEFTEIYEGLQRNTVECTTSTWSTADMGSIADVAAHVHTTEAGGIQRTASTMVAGSSFDQLPSAFQQIIFDAETAALNGYMDALAESVARNWDAVQSNEGSFTTYDPESETQIVDTQEKLVDQYIESGAITEADREKISMLVETWSQRAEDAGIVDGGTMTDFGDWFVAEDFDFDDLAYQVVEEHYQGQRPE